MASVLVVGAGRMGLPIYKAMKKLGHNVTITDTDITKIGPMSGLNAIPYWNALSDTIISKYDLVISAAGYGANELIASKVINAGIMYCDLGGHVQTSNNIKKMTFNLAKKPVFTDLGLAPGWINILAEQGLKQVPNATDVKMMVGGIPAFKQVNPFNYVLTWSAEGLYNEYTDECKVLEDGHIESRNALDGYERIYSDKLKSDLEAFYTSGASSHSIASMRERGVKNLSYKTIRWIGHHNIISYLLRSCKLKLNEFLPVLRGLLDSPRGVPYDLVILKCEVSNGPNKWSIERVYYADNVYTAMQKCTAFPLAAVADIMLSKEFDKQYLTYEDVPYDMFEERMGKLL